MYFNLNQLFIVDFFFSTAYKMLDGSPAAWAQKSVYFVSNLLGIALALYKCSSMGLLPTHSSDWLSFLEPQQVSCNFNVYLSLKIEV